MGKVSEMALPLLKKLGFDVDSKATELTLELDKLEAASSPPAPGAGTPPAVQPPGGGVDIAAMIQQAVANATSPLQQQLAAVSAALNEEKTARSAAVQALEKQQQDATKKAAEDLIDAAIKSGQIVQDKREFWISEYVKSPETTKVIVEQMQPNGAVNRQSGAASGNAPTPATAAPAKESQYQQTRAAAREAFAAKTAA